MTDTNNHSSENSGGLARMVVGLLALGLWLLGNFLFSNVPIYQTPFR